jgi:hypothetical protein
MSIKIALLKSGESVISDIKELISKESKEKIYGYIFKNPYVVDISHNQGEEEEVLLLEGKSSNKPNRKEQQDGKDVNVNFIPWIPITSDSEIMVAPDWVFSIVTPVKEIENLYEEMISGQ